MSTPIAIRGNITAPVEVRYTQGGKAVGNVTVAVNRGKDDNKQTDFHRVTLWEGLAENAAQLAKGTSVLVIGRLESREYETREGQKRTAWEITADAFGPDLRFQTAEVTRTGSTRQPQSAEWDSRTPGNSEAWSTGGGGDEQPF
ncbi:single-stranded DNA-binding protein [Microbacterium sp. Kw_RZR3]|uniref:single-stranded DNA-binding protein n=1 Tax=Microbacterium sp. Kw_RZR3 TaxID=3032903 RepID=UPI0023D9DF27|nr:single-stranded DNA-binding protein [Microbacterium sp. Kw_RZR3]MDF2046202.1 single-stranded DNA-binding protein [Microbacterium sp. Kw_RZR3]